MWKSKQYRIGKRYSCHAFITLFDIWNFSNRLSCSAIYDWQDSELPEKGSNNNQKRKLLTITDIITSIFLDFFHCNHNKILIFITDIFFVKICISHKEYEIFQEIIRIEIRDWKRKVLVVFNFNWKFLDLNILLVMMCQFL